RQALEGARRVGERLYVRQPAGPRSESGRRGAGFRAAGCRCQDHGGGRHGRWRKYRGCAPLNQERTAPRWLQPAIEYGPLLLFFVVYLSRGLMPATAVLLGATAVGLALSWFFLRRLPWLPVIAAAGLGIFGGLTLWLHDDTFIKMKPTVV